MWFCNVWIPALSQNFLLAFLSCLLSSLHNVSLLKMTIELLIFLTLCLHPVRESILGNRNGYICIRQKDWFTIILRQACPKVGRNVAITIVFDGPQVSCGVGTPWQRCFIFSKCSVNHTIQQLKHDFSHSIRLNWH